MDNRSAPTFAQQAARQGIRSTLIGVFVNIVLAALKATAGILGHSYALVADAIESASDILSSLVVIVGLTLSGKPPDENHPYGHGKFEPLAAVFVAIMLLGAAILIGVESVKGITEPHEIPAAFTLLVLIVVVPVKEILFRFVINVGEHVSSAAVKNDAWHHRSDAITSLAAFIGISIAIIGGKGYESADDFAALVASFILCVNAISLLKPALYELIDTSPDPELAKLIRSIAESVPGVLGTHKCNVRKLGFDFFVDLDILCEPTETIRKGHEISHDVGEKIHQALPQIRRILVHVEPVDDYGRRDRG